MPYVIFRGKVEDYAKWKLVFDTGGADRQAGGSKGGQLFRSASDPNEIFALFEWDDLENARQFSHNEKLIADMQKGGVLGAPDTYFLEEVEHLSV